MRSLLLVCIFVLPAMGAASDCKTPAASCGSLNPLSPCVIEGKLDSNGVRLNRLEQCYVSVQKGVPIQWKIAGGSGYFQVLLDYNATKYIFKNKDERSFQTGLNNSIGDTVQSSTHRLVVHYVIYGFDGKSKTKYKLDPKVIINP